MTRISSHFILLKIMSDLSRATVYKRLFIDPFKDASLIAHYAVQKPSARLWYMILLSPKAISPSVLHDMKSKKQTIRVAYYSVKSPSVRLCSMIIAH